MNYVNLIDLDFFCQSNGATISTVSALGSIEIPRLGDTIKGLDEMPGFHNEDFLLGGNEGEATAEETVRASQEGEIKVIKIEEQEERKRQKILRIREKVATGIKEDGPVTRYIFPEVNKQDMCLDSGGQGFSFNKEEQHFYKRVNIYGNLMDAVSYDEVVKMVGIPVIKTPVGTPSPQKGTPGTGKKGGVIFGPTSMYKIKGHSIASWAKFGDTPSAQPSKLVR